MTNYQSTKQTPLNEQGYLETKRDIKLTVDWAGAVILFAAKVAKYGFVCGIGIGIMASFWQYVPIDKASWIRTLFLILGSGLSMSGFFAALALIIQDLRYPREKPTERLRSLPPMGAPGNMKPEPLSGVVDGSHRRGKLRLHPQQQLALCNAVMRDGIEVFSQREFARLGVVPTKEHPDGKQLKADFIWTGLGKEGANGTVEITDAFMEWAIGIFPALASPYPNGN